MAVIVAGLDVGFSNDYMALVVVRKVWSEGRDLIVLEHLCTWKKMNWDDWKRDMVSKNKQFRISKVYVDQTNNQSVVAELKSLGIFTEGVTFTNPAKRDMVLNLQKLLSTGELIFPVPEKIESVVQQKHFEELLAEMVEQEVDQHARDRHIGPQRQGPACDAFVVRELPPKRAQ